MVLFALTGNSQVVSLENGHAFNLPAYVRARDMPSDAT